MEIDDITLSVTYQDYTDPKEIKWVVYHSLQTTGTIVEIGCNKGTTTYELATHNPTRQVIGVDHTDETVIKVEDDMMPGIVKRVGDPAGNPQFNEVPTLEEFGSKVRDLENVTLVNIDSKDFEYSADTHFIFIDADHRYDAVKIDTDKAIAHINNVGGTIMWHDCYDTAPDWVGVKAYLATIPGIQYIPDTWLAYYMVSI